MRVFSFLIRTTNRRVLVALVFLATAGCGSGASPDSTRTKVADKADTGRQNSSHLAGYVDDNQCARCHRELFDSYNQTGMARSFAAPQSAAVIEEFGEEFLHAPSGQHFQMSYSDGRYFFRRFQQAEDGLPINVVEVPVDWILGSGNNSRTYLYQTPAGELFQLPIAWYSEEHRWGMAPGFDRPDHDGITRKVRRECMFCHNAYPDVPPESDGHGTSQTFPRNLPQGIGCQRCHGPGEEHVQANLAGTASPTAGIVNPSKLSAALRDDVCHQCHMQPTVAMFGMRRFGRHDYSFEPGQSLDDYQVPLEIVDENRPAEDRFEINHHPYRLQQSPCFQNSSGKLNCLTCHDPHHRVPTGNRADHYRSACLQCHAENGCDRAERLTPDTGDCVQCHMPRRRTQDVVHVIATDHRIARIPDDSGKRLQGLRESEPQIEEVILSPEDRQSNIGGVLRAVAILRATNGHHRPAAEHLARQLARQKIAAIEPALDLANAQLVSGQADAALKTLSVVLDQHPTNAQAHEFLGLAKLQQGQIDAADQALRESLKLDPHRPVAALNLGRLELTRENPQAAVVQLRTVVEAHPTLAAAWYFLGEAHSRQSQWRNASNCYRRALEIDPTLKDAYHGIERALKELGRPDEAARYKRHSALKAAGQ